MKLKNKETGEVIDSLQRSELILDYNSLAELNEEWEDYEEPNGWWYIDENYEVHTTNSSLRDEEKDREMGNCFPYKEEAEKAVEKLKAWRRLKDKGFDFEYVGGYENLCGNGFEIPITATMPPEAYTDVEVSKDLDIIFEGEE